MTRPTVAVLFTRPEAIHGDIGRLMDLAHLPRMLEAGTDTVLKGVTSWHRPFPAVNTTPWQLEGVIAGLRARGFQRLAMLLSEGVANRAEEAEEALGYLPVLKAHLVPAFHASRPGHVNWETYAPRQEMLVLHKLFPKGIPIPDFLLGKNLISLPTLKTDPHLTLAGASAAALTAFLPESRYKAGPELSEVVVDLLAIQRETQAGLFAVMDGTMAGDGRGPRLVTPVQKNVILASGDPLALDAIALKMMGFDPMDVPYVRMAHERGLGVGRPSEIEVVGDDVAGESWNFQVLQGRLSRLAALGARGPVKGLLGRRSLFEGARRVSHLYHDVYQWRTGEAKETFKTWRRESPWGALFDRYQIEGHLLG